MVVAKWPDLYSNLVSAEISHRNFASIRAKKWNFCNCKKKLCFTQRNLDRAGEESASFESMVLCAKAFYSLASSLTSLSTQHIADAIITGFTLVEGDRRTACCYHLSSLHLLFFPLESSSFKSSGSCTTCNHVNSTSDDRNFSGFLPLLLISCSSTRNLIVVQLFFLL